MLLRHYLLVGLGRFRGRPSCRLLEADQRRLNLLLLLIRSKGYCLLAPDDSLLICLLLLESIYINMTSLLLNSYQVLFSSERLYEGVVRVQVAVVISHYRGRLKPTLQGLLLDHRQHVRWLRTIEARGQSA